MMELHTQRFGTIRFEPEEVIAIFGGLDGQDGGRQWLLLADECHPQLWWLQSVARPERSVPVTSLPPMEEQRLAPIVLRGFSDPCFRSGDQAVMLWQLSDARGRWTLDRQHPIVINARTSRGLQLSRIDDDQSAQHERSEQTASLRESA